MNIICPSCGGAGFKKSIFRSDKEHSCNKCFKKFDVDLEEREKNKPSILHLEYKDDYYQGERMGGYHDVNAYLIGKKAILHAMFKAQYIEDMSGPYDYELENINHASSDDKVVREILIYTKLPLIADANTTWLDNEKYYIASLIIDLIIHHDFWCLQDKSHVFLTKSIHNSLSSRNLFLNLIEYYNKVFPDIDVNMEFNPNGFNVVSK